MTVEIDPKLAEWINEQVEEGRYSSPEAAVHAALRVAIMDELFEDADKKPSPRKTPLPREAFHLEVLYDDRA